MRTAVLGAGAIGAVIAQSLFDAYGNSCFAVADRHRIAERPRLFLNGAPSTFPWHPIEEPTAVDVVIIAVKGYHLESVLEALGPWIGEKTHILSLLNGINSEKIIGEKFGSEKIPLSLAVGQDTLRRGNEITYTRKGKILLGERHVPSASPRVEAICDMLVRGGVPCEIPRDMTKELYWKFMVNVGINQVSAVLDAPYGLFQTPGKARNMMLASIEEVRLVLGLERIELTDEDVQRWLDLLSGLSPSGETSMLQDVRAGRSTEVDLFAGTLMKLAAKHGVDVPLNRQLYRKLAGEDRNLA